MKCPKCKALVVNGNFCTKCGAKLPKDNPALNKASMRIKNRQHAIAAIHKAQKYNCDLIYISSNRTCPICSQYNRKTYSISGKSKTYPLLAQIVLLVLI